MAKRLDRFLLREDVATKIPVFRQWVGEGGNSDHLPVLLELKGPLRKPTSPFKFNPYLLMEDSYNTLFKKTWRLVRPSGNGEKYFNFMEKLKRLKKATIECARDKKLKEYENLKQIEVELAELECPEAYGYETIEKRDWIKMLETQRRKILLAREEQWRFKSRSIWLRAENIPKLCKRKEKFKYHLVTKIRGWEAGKLF